MYFLTLEYIYIYIYIAISISLFYVCTLKLGNLGLLIELKLMDGLTSESVISSV